MSASSPREWVENVLDLLEDPGKRERLGRSGRRYVETYHCWDTCLEPLGSLLGLPQLPHAWPGADAPGGSPRLVGAQRN